MVDKEFSVSGSETLVAIEETIETSKELIRILSLMLKDVPTISGSDKEILQRRLDLGYKKLVRAKGRINV